MAAALARRLQTLALALAALCVLCLLGLPGLARAQAPAADDKEVSDAEKLLFDTDHLSNIDHLASLAYRYSTQGDKPVTDRIVLNLGGATGRTVVPDYLTGERHVEFPSIEDAHGNPLLLYFLEYDLREMRRQTQGQSDYFRRILRRAMARPDLKIEPFEATTADGRKVAAKRIVLEPFRGDPNAATRYPGLIAKRYEFVLSAEVPGQILLLASRVPKADGGADTVRVEWTAAPAK